MEKINPGIYQRPDGSYDVRTTLRLHPTRDADLLAVILAAPKGRLAAIVKGLMRSGVSAGVEHLEEEVEIDLSGLGGEI